LNSAFTVYLFKGLFILCRFYKINTNFSREWNKL
jgi:hypothetical protein